MEAYATEKLSVENHSFGNIFAGLLVMKHAHNEPQMFVICIGVIVIISLKNICN